MGPAILERFASGDNSDSERAELQLRVHIGELRVHEAIHSLRNKKAASQDPGLHGAETSASSTSTPGPEETRVYRKRDDLLEAYRRLSRPERVQRNWTADRWAAVSQVLTKLRGLAGVSGWPLPAPAVHLSRDPAALVDTGIDDPISAAEAIDIAEGAIEARILRIAVRLVVDKTTSGRIAEVKTLLSQEAHTFARLALAHLRTTGMAIETLLDPESLSPSAWAVLAKGYGAFAAGIASLRQHLGEDVEKVLQSVQDNLSNAATAACKLGLAAGPMITPPLDLGGQATAASRLARNLSKTPADVAKAVAAAAQDPFKPLHQSTLLSSIALLAESVWTSVDSAANPSKSRLAEDLDPEKEKLIKFDEGASIADLADWPVEFTSSQLGLVKRALRDRQPDVAGALALLQDTLDHYARLAEAMGRAYGDERTLRANPSDLVHHQGLISLLRQLRSSWRDTGAVLVPSRQADLLALEKVRLRHQGLVNHAFRAGGHEVAAVVLARLALVDEMLEPPGRRRLTSEVPWEWKRPYSIVEGVIRCLGGEGGLAARQFRRRRRWLRCPHSTTRMVLTGEVWRQLFARFMSLKPGFEALGGCFHIPLTLREFRVACCFLELNFSERQLTMIYESAVDMTAQLAGEPASGQATLRDLQRMVKFFGPQGSGDLSAAAEAVVAANKGLEERDDDDSSSCSPDDQGAPRSSSPRVASLPKAILAPSVCPRCLAGEMPNFPHVSVGELNRRHGPAASSEGLPAAAQAQPPSGEEEAAGRELGEDLMLGWATSALASGILLSKDEQGAYFRWLARTVLYSTEGSATAGPGKAAAAPEAKARYQRGKAPGAPGAGGSAARRFSFASSLTAALPLLDGQPDLARDAAPSGEGPAADAAVASARPGEEDVEGLREARDDIARTLPEAMLSALRIDVGLMPASSQASTDDYEVKRIASLHIGQRQRHRNARALTSGLLASIHERVTRDELERKAQRASREAKLIASLRGVGVPESELSFLQQEFALLTSEVPASSQLLLVGGAARAAQSIVVPNPALKLKHTQEIGTTASAFPGESPGDECSNRATATAAAGRRAQEVVEASELHTSHCYSRVCSGYMPPDRRYHVAAALRFLEHELFSVEEGGSAEAAALRRGRPASRRASRAETAGEDGEPMEKTTMLAHMLLPRDAARRLIVQLKRDEIEYAVVAPTAEVLGASSERRKAIPSGLSVRVLSMEQGDSDSSESFLSTPTPTPSHRRRRRLSVGGSQTRSPSRGSRSPKLGSPVTSARSSSSKPGKLRTAVRRMSSMNRGSNLLEPGEISPSKAEVVKTPIPPSTPQVPTRPATGTDQTPELWQDLADWPSGVQGLLSAVDARGRRLRFATRLGLSTGDREGRSKGSSAYFAKSRSTGTLPCASASRGATPPSAAMRRSGQHCARQVDRVRMDGWRVRLPEAPDLSLGRSPSLTLPLRAA